MLDDIPDDELREWVTEYVRRFDAHMEQLNRKLDALQAQIGGVQDSVDSIPPAIQQVLDYWETHPEVKEMSVRKQAPIVGVSKSTISDAKRYNK